MINSIRRRGRASKFASLAVVACMTVGVGLIATPAFAEDPPAAFLPDDTAPSGEANQLSDRFDGHDQLAHLTGVATTAADRMDFYVCPVGADAGSGTIEQAELPQCTLIGSDTTANTPAQSTFVLNIDEAYEFFWDIPTALDTLSRDILMLACTGTGTVVSGAGQNCSQSLEEAIFLDDAAGGTAGQTSSGEIVSMCTTDPDVDGIAPGGPLGNDTCYAGTTTQGSTQRATIDARFELFKHGDAIPDTGALFRVSTSTDIVNPNPPLIGIDIGADANDDPDTLTAFTFCTQIETFPDRTTWECQLTNAQLGAGVQEAAIYTQEDGGGGGTGDCAGGGGVGTCVFDSHYTAITPRAAAAVKQSWVSGGGHTHQPPSPGANAGCEAGETQVKSHSNPTLVGTETGEICVTDQFGDPLPGVDVLEEITAPGNLNGGNDHDGDGRNEHDDGGVTGSSGTVAFTVSNFNSTPGSATLTSCVEGQPTSTTTGHGCTNETLKDTLTVSWATTPNEVFLAYTGTATNASDPCRTGATIANGVVGQRESLIVCTFDSSGNPVSTDVDASRLQWTITGAHGADQPSVRFVGSPPQETGGNAQATVEIEDIGPGDNFIQVTLLNANGDFQDAFFVEKDVAGAADKCKKIARRIRNLKQQRRIAKAAGNDEKVDRLTKKIKRLQRKLRRCRRNA
jgi:hypothetical protein